MDIPLIPLLLSGPLQSLQKKALGRERSGGEDVGVCESPGVGVGVGRTLLQITFLSQSCQSLGYMEAET